MNTPRTLCTLAYFSSLCASAAWAHPPHEHTPGTPDTPPPRVWNDTRTARAIRGTLLTARATHDVLEASIEQADGSIVLLPLADLDDAGQAEVLAHIAFTRALNESSLRQPSPPAADPAPTTATPKPAQATPFAFFAPAVKTRWDARWLYVESDGLPHAPWTYPLMVGIRSWQQQVPLPQAYTSENAWRIPLTPELADTPVSAKTHLYRGAIALAANGVPIFNALNNRGEDASKAGELDEFGGHCGRADDYHYHVAPLAIQKIVGTANPIAYALDGFPIYGLFDPAHTPGQPGACPLAGSAPLDEFNGHFGAPPKDAPAKPGLYHYHASLTYPYINGGMRGKVTIKDDQIDPQPRATPVRQWLQPLRGATVTAFKTIADRSWSLEYTLRGTTHQVNYHIEGEGDDARYVFSFVEPDGASRTESFRARPQRNERDRPPRGPRPRESPPGPDTRPPAAPKHAAGVLWLGSADVTGGRLSTDCTCDGAGRAPALSWGEAPAGVKAYAVVMHHVPPEGGTHVYMVVANIPASSTELPGGRNTVGTWGQNSVNRHNEYTPPCSKGPGDKSYTITLYALSAETPVTPPLTRDSLLAGIRTTTLATATLEVTYARTASERGGSADR